MKTLQEATEKICDLKGSILAMQALLNALIHTLPIDRLPTLQTNFEAQIEAAQSVLLGARVSEHTLDAIDRDAQLLLASLQSRMEQMGIRRARD